IAEYLIGLVDFLEACLRRLVAGIHVRMVLAGQLPVGLLQLLVGGGLGHAERGIVVLEFHRYSPRILFSASSSRTSRWRASPRVGPSSPTSGLIRSTTSATESRRCTPARFTPTSSTRCLISRRRSSSSRV